MAKKIYDTKNMPESEWLEKRKEGIGASEAAVAMGISKWKSPQQLYMEKKGIEKPFEGNIRTALGHHLEPFIKDLFEKETGHNCQRRHVIYGHDDYPFIRANLDFFSLTEKVPVEIKSSSSLKTSDWEDGNIPSDYYWQCQQQLAIMGTEHMYIAVLFLVAGEFRYFRIQRDNDSIDILIELESLFWRNFTDGILPEINHADSNRINSRYAQGVDGVKLIDSSYIPLLQRREEVCDLINRLENEKETIDTKLKSELESLEIGEAGPFKVTWRRPGLKTVSVFDEESFKNDYPKLYPSYLKPKEVQGRNYFSIKRKKEEN